jgi:hypothetical protein
MTLQDQIIKDRYPFYDPDNVKGDIKISSDEAKVLMNDLIDKILDLYVPDGNPEIFLQKILKLKSYPKDIPLPD